MQSILISIITINLNNASGLKKTLQSIKKQKYTNYESIVIDGGSSDYSREVIKDFNSIITYSISEKDQGIYNAQNKGILKSNGKYLLFLNSGDYFYSSDTLFHVSNSLETNLFDLVSGDLLIQINNDYRIMKSQTSIKFDFLMNSTIWHPSTFIKKNLFLKLGLYREDLRICSDYDFFFKACLVHNCSYLYVDLPISIFQLNGISSDESNLDLINKERSMIQNSYLPKKVIEYYNSNKELISEIENFKLSRLYKLIKEIQKLKKYLLTACKKA